MLKVKNGKEHRKVSLLKVLLFGLKMNLSAIPVLFIVINIIAILHGVSHGFATFMTQRFYDSVESVLRDRNTIRYAYMMIIG